MSISKTKTVLVGVVAAGFMTWQPANAGFSQGDAVTMAGQPVLRMAAADGFSANHRAWMAQDSLDNALVLASDRSPTALTISRENGAVVLLLDGRRIATVDSDSAQAANLTVDDLAQQWAQSIMSFLGDKDRTEAYVATLKNANAVQANVAVLERRMYAPAGMIFPVTLSTLIVGADAKTGDAVEATIDLDVPMGHYVIPAGSTVLGEIVGRQQDNFSLRFTSLRTPNGTLLPIDATVVENFIVQGRSAHLVCTYALPSGMANGLPQISGRVPAAIGIGASGDSTNNVLVFQRSAGDLAIGRPLYLQLGTVTQVAVVMRGTAM